MEETSHGEPELGIHTEVIHTVVDKRIEEIRKEMDVLFDDLELLREEMYLINNYPDHCPYFERQWSFMNQPEMKIGIRIGVN